MEPGDDWPASVFDCVVPTLAGWVVDRWCIVGDPGPTVPRYLPTNTQCSNDVPESFHPSSPRQNLHCTTSPHRALRLGAASSASPDASLVIGLPANIPALSCSLDMTRVGCECCASDPATAALRKHRRAAPTVRSRQRLPCRGSNIRTSTPPPFAVRGR